MLWFATAYTIIIIFHEGAHALTAVAVGIPSTLFNFWVNHDFTRATPGERAAVGVAGPAVSLCVGLVCWFIYRRVKHSTAGLPFVYLTAFGVSNFFGNLVSAAFVGDFSNAAIVLGLSPIARYAGAFTGAVALTACMFFTGRELRHWIPDHVGRIAGAVGLIAVPAVIGTALVIVINQPTPMGSSFVSARAAEGSFWFFAVIGMLVGRHRPTADGRFLRFRWIDGAIALVLVVALRMMARASR